MLYEDHIREHMSSGLSADKARQAAVGGDFDEIGKIERDCLLSLGLSTNSKVVDLGCGAGRLARQLVQRIGPDGGYLGLDVSPTLIEEASRHIGGNLRSLPFQFQVISNCHMPCEEKSKDFVVAFSVVTHIDLEDTFSYLKESFRVLRVGGRMVVSYLSAEIPDHWDIFLREGLIPYEHRYSRVRNHVFMPGVLQYLVIKAGLSIESDFKADEPWIPLTESVDLFGKAYDQGEIVHLGQACLILKKDG